MGSKVQDVDPTMVTGQSNVVPFYTDKTILITGGTGFLGKVLIFKLLKTCPDLKKIFLIVRHKKGFSPDERIQKLTNDSPLFAELKKYNPNYLQKITGVEGDLTKPNLGLMEDDEATLIRETNIVFHSGASVRFDEDLSNAFNVNVRATMSLVKMAKKMPNLDCFVHVSTAYSHCNDKYIYERVYMDDRFDPRHLEDITKETSEDVKANLVGDFPNTYTFTKAVAEWAVVKEGAGLPLCIVRPSVVVASVSEPLPGWVDSSNGPTGLIAACCTGLLRTALVSQETELDIVPVDSVINLMCVAAAKNRKRMEHDSTNVPVYNHTFGDLNPMKLKSLFDYIVFVRKYPFENLLWYPGGAIHASRMAHLINLVLFTYIPAFLADLILPMCGRRPFLVKTVKRIQRMINVVSHFIQVTYTWEKKAVPRLWQSLNKVDQELFDFDFSSKDLPSFYENFILGIRRYLLKQSDSTLPRSRQVLFIFKLVHYLVCFSGILLPILGLLLLVKAAF